MPQQGTGLHRVFRSLKQLWMAKERARKDGRDWMWEVMAEEREKASTPYDRCPQRTLSGCDGIGGICIAVGDFL